MGVSDLIAPTVRQHAWHFALRRCVKVPSSYCLFDGVAGFSEGGGYSRAVQGFEPGVKLECDPQTALAQSLRKRGRDTVDGLRRWRAWGEAGYFWTS